MMRAVAAAFAFLTRLPVGRGAVADRDLGRAVGFFPLVGIALGLVTLAAAHVAADHLPPPLVAVALVALLAALTGALHLDGLADVFDGLAGGRGDRERTLAIMRDSRIGAAGAVALVLVLTAKVVAVGAFIGARDFLPLLTAPVVARWAVAPQIVLFPYARAEGLGRAFGDQSGPRELATATVLVLGMGMLVGADVAVQAGAAIGVALGLAFWFRRRLGGLTGDVYGATIEIAEVAALFAASLR